MRLIHIWAGVQDMISPFTPRIFVCLRSEGVIIIVFLFLFIGFIVDGVRDDGQQQPGRKNRKTVARGESSMEKAWIAPGGLPPTPG